MRPRASVIGQLLVAFCVCAVLIGLAAVAGFVSVTGIPLMCGSGLGPKS